MLFTFVLMALGTIATANDLPWPAEPFTPETAFPVTTVQNGTNHRIDTRGTPQISARGKKDCEFNFCTEADDYPADYILKTLKESGTYDDYFTEMKQNGEEAFDIGSRIKPDDTEMTMCSTRRRSMYPKTAVNVGKKERVIVNVEGYQQAVVFEVCEDSKGKCRFNEMFPNDYTTSCKQKYSIRRLVALNDQNKPSFDSFEMPSCCVCTVTKNA